MADEIDISHGGAVSVDTEVLRALIPRFTAVGAALEEAATALRGVPRSEPFATFAYPNFPLYIPGIEGAVQRTSDATHDTAASVRLMADAYEIVEQRAQVQLHATAGELVEMTELSAALKVSEHANPQAFALANDLISQWKSDRHRGFISQGWSAGAFGLPAVIALWMAGKAIDKRGAGVVAPGTTLSGTPAPVTVFRRDLGAVSPPKSVHEFVSRTPRGKAQVRVERYTMPDGAKKYATYIAGTRSFLGDDPWNMDSNLDLYLRDEASQSYAAVMQALEEAGARPGDTVYVNGHSQGAMIGGRLVMSELYDVPLAVTEGMPITIVASADTLHVDIRHTDDPVSALSQGGAVGGSGATHSVLVERHGDPGLGLHDLKMKTHVFDSYLDTVELFENSGDPRVAEVQARLAALGLASQVEAFEFHAVAGEETSGGASSSAGAESPRAPR